MLLRGTKMSAVGPDSPDRGKRAASQTSSKVFCGVSPPGIVRLPEHNKYIEVTPAGRLDCLQNPAESDY